MRKLLCANTLLAVALPFFIVGCGSTPTAPTTAPITQTEVTAPTPVPSPTPSPAPTPAPAPSPAPAPAPPTPAPTPGPSQPTGSAVYDAHVNTVQWYGTPLFTTTDIEIVRYPDRIVLGSMVLPIVQEDERSVLARTNEMTFSAVDSAWTFNGLAGQGSGTWVKK